MDSTSSESWILDELLTLLAVDREAGRRLPLEHYQRLFPEHADLVATEYEGATQAGPDEGAADALAASDELGPYQLREELGRGSQGVVFLAEDRRLGRTVALKILEDRGWAIDASARERFRREAAITSKLEHPSICAIYDAGEEEGRPYIAMRYVRGEPLSAKLKRDRPSPSTAVRLGEGELAPEEDSSGSSRRSSARAELMAVVAFVEKVARAMDVAHEAGVVHRDLKPGNVMVTPAGEPVILDFGLARDESRDQVSLTSPGDAVGTPAYMSPEQLSPTAVRLDGRTDVWSLGVLLYECLTGERPFQSPSRQGLCQAIRFEEPVDPRRLNPRLPRDVAVILGKALEKDRQHRYQTALDLAEDLRRVRELEPILARSPSAAQRLWRWAQRSPGLAASLVTVFALLAGGLVLSLHSARVEADLRQSAEQRFESVRELAHDVLFEVYDALAATPGTTGARALIVQRAVEHLDLLAQDAADHPDLERELVESWVRLGDIQGNEGDYSYLGDVDGALASFEKAERTARELIETEDTDFDRRNLGRIESKIGGILYGKGQVAEGLERTRAGLALLEPLARAHPDDPTMQYTFAVASYNLAVQSYGHDDIETAREAALEARAVTETLIERAPQDQEYLLLHAVVLSHLGNLAGALQDGETAEQCYLEAIDTYRSAGGFSSGNARVMNRLAESHSKLANLLSFQRRTGAALDHLEQALTIRDTVLAVDPNDVGAKAFVCEVYLGFGEAYETGGDPFRARQSYGDCLSMADETLAVEPGNRRAILCAAMSNAAMGKLLMAEGDPEAAEAHLVLAVEQFDGLVERQVAHRRNATRHAGCLFRLAEIAVRGGDENLALDRLYRGVEILERADSERQRDLNLTLCHREIARILTRRSDVDGAEAHLNEAARMQPRPASPPEIVVCCGTHLTLARLVAEMGRPRDAHEHLGRAVASLGEWSLEFAGRDGVTGTLETLAADVIRSAELVDAAVADLYRARIEGLWAELAERAGDPDEAARRRAAGSELMSALDPAALAAAGLADQAGEL